VIHRNLTLENCFLSPNGTVKIGNFAAAVSASSEKSPTSASTISTTTLPSHLASEYIAPEGRRNEWSSKSDIWSLGVCAWKLRIGKDTPLVKVATLATSPDQLSKSITASFRTPEKELVQGFLAQCLVVHPSERATAEELLRHPLGNDKR